MGVKHAYQSATPDNPEKEISSSEWNADHTVDDGSLTIAKTTGLQAALDGKQDRTGFPLAADGTPAVTLTYSSADRKFTVTAKTGATFDLYVNGAKITTDSPYVSAAHDATIGNWFLYHDGSNFVWSSSPWNLMLHAPIGLVYWDGANGVGFLETHTVSRDPALHRRLHEVDGTTLVSGGVLADWLADTDTDAGCTFSITQAVIADEDLRSTIAALADGGPYTLWYRSGANGDWTFTTGLSFPFTFGTYPQYNKNTAGTWSLADLTANDFGVFYVLATPAVTSGHGFIIVPGQQDFTTRALADADSFASLSVGTLPFQEFCVIAKVVMEAKASYQNAYNAVIKAITRLTASRSLATTTAPTQHNTLNGLQGGAPGSSEYYHLTAAEVAALHPAVTVADTTSINLTLTGQQISADAIFGTGAGTVAEGNHTHAGYQATSEKGQANGYASLDAGGKVPSAQLPSAQTGEAFPVGSVFISVVSTNPATLLGYGTWSAIAAGRMLVGIDSGDTDFDTPEETGGSKTSSAVVNHTHDVTVTDPGHTHVQKALPTATGGVIGNTRDTTMSGTPAATGVSTESATTGITASTANPAGGVASFSLMNPYFVVYMWKRTA